MNNPTQQPIQNNEVINYTFTMSHPEAALVVDALKQLPESRTNLIRKLDEQFIKQIQEMNAKAQQLPAIPVATPVKLSKKRRA